MVILQKIKRRGKRKINFRKKEFFHVQALASVVGSSNYLHSPRKALKEKGNHRLWRKMIIKLSKI